MNLNEMNITDNEHGTAETRRRGRSRVHLEGGGTMRDMFHAAGPEPRPSAFVQGTKESVRPSMRRMTP